MAITTKSSIKVNLESKKRPLLAMIPSSQYPLKNAFRPKRPSSANFSTKTASSNYPNRAIANCYLQGKITTKPVICQTKKQSKSKKLQKIFKKSVFFITSSCSMQLAKYKRTKCSVPEIQKSSLNNLAAGFPDNMLFRIHIDQTKLKLPDVFAGVFHNTALHREKSKHLAVPCKLSTVKSHTGFLIQNQLDAVYVY